MVSHPAPQSAGRIVGRSLPVFLLLACALCALMVAAGVARADEGVSTGNYKAQETVTITVNALGDAHYEDVVKYESGFFNTAGFSFDKYPFLLSRRFEQKAAVSEIANFKSKLNRDAATVTLTFDKPGYAYNLGDHWMLPGFYSEPTLQTKSGRVFQQQSTENNEFTLWQDLDFSTTTHLKLPAAVKNVRWDEEQNAVLYELAYVAPAPPENVLQRNRTLFLALFAALIAISLAGAATLLLRRRPIPVPATAVSHIPPEPEALPAGPAPTLVAPEEPEARGPAVLAAPVEEVTAETVPEGGADLTAEEGEVLPPDEPSASAHRPRFCEHCGEQLSGEAQFCPECGRHVSNTDA